MDSREAPSEWRQATVADVLVEHGEPCGDASLPLLSITKARGMVPAADRFTRGLHNKNRARYRVAKRDEFVVDPMLLWDGQIARQRVMDAGIVSPDYRVYSVAEGHDPAFLEFWFRSPSMRQRYAAAARGTNVRRSRVSRDDFMHLPVMLPGVAEQRKISAILSSVDNAIEGTQAVIDQLQVVKKAMMADLLTRGIPGRHKKFKMTEIGEVPVDWEVVPLAELAKRICVGIVVKPASYYTDTGVPCLRGKNIKEDRLMLDDVVFISPESNAILGKSMLHAGDVVTVRTGEPGTSCVVPAALDGTNCIDLIITTPGPRVDGYFLSRFLNSAGGRGIVATGKGGLAQQHFNVGAMKEMPVPVPDRKEQQAIIATLSSVDDRLAQEAGAAEGLKDLKSALMSVLLTGEVRVRVEKGDS